MNATIKLLLSGKDNIILNTQLAVEIGLNEAIVLRQVYYWVEHYEAEKKNFRDGKYWVYNSMKQWRADNFPFMSEKTIERAFKSLREKELILVGDYSSDRMKRPNWYTVNDEKFEELIKKITKSEGNSDEPKEENKEHSEKKETECLNGVRQNDGMQPDIPTGCYNIYNNINNTNTENTNRDYSTENTDKYALKDKSFKDCDNMYASVSEKQEEEQKPKKKSRYIPKDYTEEQLREHIRPTIRENFERIEIENGLGRIPDGEKLLEDITVEFFRQYEENMGVKHRPLPDKSYINVIRMFVCSTGELREYFDLETYEIMIKRYFQTDFNRYGKYDGEVTLCLSHFMNDTIRNHLLNREGILWERADDEED